MYVIYVSRYKKRALLLVGIVIIWLTAILISRAILNNTLMCSITIDNYLSFSYPLDYHVKDIYINQDVKNNSIETGLSAERPAISKFTTENENFIFNYPTVFNLSNIIYRGTEVLYHINYIDDAKDLYGFIQVWSHPCTIEQFIEASIKYTDRKYEKSSVKKIKVNTLPGCYWDYSVLAADNKMYKGCEIFLCKNDKLYRICCFTGKASWNKHKFNEFKEIVYSFKAY